MPLRLPHEFDLWRGFRKDLSKLDVSNTHYSGRLALALTGPLVVTPELAQAGALWRYGF